MSLLLAGCTAHEAQVTAPGDLHEQPASLMPPGTPSLNSVTTSTQLTTLVGVGFVPAPGSTTQYDYELRFSFNGYSGAHMEPRWGVSGLPSLEESQMQAVIRTGSSDYVHLEICARDYDDFGIYLGCFGSGSADFYASDNNVTKAVTFNEDFRVSHSSGMFRLTLQWPPVSVTPSSVSITPASLPLTVGFLTRELVATAYDANGQAIPGLSISWSSADPSVASIDASGFATPQTAGSTTATAVIGAVSATAPITVFTPLSVGIDGPTEQQPNQTCSFMAQVFSEDVVQPVSYTWLALGQSGSDQFFYPNSAGASNSYTISLMVEGANGRLGAADQTVSVGSQYQPCPE